MSKTNPMAFVVAPGRIEFRDYTPPELGAQDVRIKVKAVTICGSDLHIFKGKHPAADLPVPVGHEIAGEVETVGSAASKLKPGDRVVVEPVLVCGECPACLRGQYHLCRQISFQYRQGQGGITPHFTAAERWVHRLPEQLTYAEGALLEPLAVAVHALKKSGLEMGSRAAIFGAGAIGLLLTQLARQAGAAQVLAADIQPARLDLARQFGATRTINSLEEDPLAVIAEETGGSGVSHAFEAVGLEITLKQALQAVAKGGTTVLVGLFEKPEIQLPANIFVQKEITLSGSQGYAWDFQTAIALVRRGGLQLAPLISHHFPMEQTQQAFETLLDPQARAVKVAILLDE